MEELLEGEIATPLAWDRLAVPVSALKSAKLPQLGETVTPQRTLLDEAVQQKATSSIETIADAAYTPRAAREWEGVGTREWPRRLTVDEQRLERGTEFKDDGADWVVEGIDYCEDKEWVVYCYAAAESAPPQTLGECEWSSVGEVLKWAFDIDQPATSATSSGSRSSSTGRDRQNEGSRAESSAKDTRPVRERLKGRASSATKEGHGGG